jgi:hypothetical protein
MWLGGNDLENEGDWRWLDETQVGEWTKSWGLDQPGGSDEHCLAYWTDYMWHDVSCTVSLKTLCKFKI